jgi:hypothetical protein
MRAASGQIFVPWIRTSWRAAIVSAAALFAISAAAADTVKQTSESILKGYRLTTSIDQQNKRAQIELNGTRLAQIDDAIDIGQVRTIDAMVAILFSIEVKTSAGCGTHYLVSAPVGSSKTAQLVSDFGTCNSRMVARVEKQTSWGAWYAVAYRNDEMTAQVAYLRAGAVAVAEVQTRPCLFAYPMPRDCIPSVAIDAIGTPERGLPSGHAEVAGHKIETFLNSASGKATLELDDKPLRTFDSAADFFIAATAAEKEFGVLGLWLKPRGDGCKQAIAIVFSNPTAAPQIVPNFAPCTEKIVHILSKQKIGFVWLALAFAPGKSTGYLAKVVNGKFDVKTVSLPSCFTSATTEPTAECRAKLLGRGSGKSPQVRRAPPRSSPDPKVRTLGI